MAASCRKKRVRAARQCHPANAPRGPCCRCWWARSPQKVGRFCIKSCRIATTILSPRSPGYDAGTAARLAKHGRHRPPPKHTHRRPVDRPAQVHQRHRRHALDHHCHLRACYSSCSLATIPPLLPRKPQRCWPESLKVAPRSLGSRRCRPACAGVPSPAQLPLGSHQLETTCARRDASDECLHARLHHLDVRRAALLPCGSQLRQSTACAALRHDGARPHALHLRAGIQGQLHLAAHRRESREASGVPPVAGSIHALPLHRPCAPFHPPTFGRRRRRGPARDVLLGQHQHHGRHRICLSLCALICEHDFHSRAVLRALPAHPRACGHRLSRLHVCALPGHAHLVEVSVGHGGHVHAVRLLALRHAAAPKQLPHPFQVPHRGSSLQPRQDHRRLDHAMEARSARLCALSGACATHRTSIHHRVHARARRAAARVDGRLDGQGTQRPHQAALRARVHGAVRTQRIHAFGHSRWPLWTRRKYRRLRPRPFASRRQRHHLCARLTSRAGVALGAESSSDSSSPPRLVGAR
ncbi:hypothetical protein L1887_51210 [Cichorium endivia]|nr:hypothetical protein L1887_51210 [Cichorium endivia]